jgi:phenylacetate-coenzyme A ligase PaaK-like adenylate-forming protein
MPDELGRLRALTAELLARDGWSREELLDHQHARLRALLDHAVEHSSYYREVLGREAARRPFDELPTLPKATFVDEWDRIVCDSRLTLAGVEAHAAGPGAAGTYMDAFRVVTTSGASGLRGVFVYDDDGWRTSLASCLRVLARAGIGEGTRLSAIGAPDPAHMSKQIFAALASESSPSLSALTPVPELVNALNGFRPTALAGYSGVMAALAGEQLDGRLRIEPRVVACSSEAVTEDVRARIASAWGVAPVDVYATTEAAVVAASTPEHPRTLELTEDLLVVEVVDDDGRAALPGVPGAKVLLTSLVNFTQPLIRYELSDRVTLADGPSPSGRPYTHLETIDGRADDTILVPGRTGGVVALLPYRLGAPFATLPDVRRYKIVWDGSGLCVRVVLRPGAGDGLERVRTAVTRSLAEAGAAPLPVEVEAVSDIPREPGAAAKFKLVESLSP